MLKGKKIILRSLDRKDINIIYDIICDEDVREFDGSHTIMPSKQYILDNFRTFSDLTSRNLTKRLTIANGKDVVVGYISYKELEDTRNVYEIGITIGKRFWNRGYGEDSIITLLKYLFLNKAAQRVELEVVDLNVRARACYKKCSFKKEGVKRKKYFMNGEYRDVVLMSILKDEFIEKFITSIKY